VWTTQLAGRIALKKYTRPAAFDHLAEDNISHTAREHVSPKGPSEETSEHSDETSEPEKPSTAAVRSKEGDQTPLKKLSTTETAKNAYLPPQPVEQPVQRTIKLVFSPWAGGPVPEQSRLQEEVEFEIWKGGLRAVQMGRGKK
jgi:DNA repair protein RAD57